MKVVRLYESDIQLMYYRNSSNSEFLEEQNPRVRIVNAKASISSMM